MAEGENPSGIEERHAVGAAERLNHGCFCVSLDRPALMQALDTEIGVAGFAADFALTHPVMFSNVPVFIDPETMSAMVDVVDAIEAASQLPAFRDAAQSWTPPIAQIDHGPLGALMGYDFHVAPTGPRLIEVNTNAGGVFLNAALAAAQRACCGQVAIPLKAANARSFAERVCAMFVAEWQRQRGSGRPKTIAIVDDDPQAQFLLPEFRLAKGLLERAGFAVIVADAAMLVAGSDGLSIDGQRIDLVYNRLVDFAFEEPRHAALRSAFAAGTVVVTPNPHAYARLADKRVLTLLSSPDRISRWGLSAARCETLRRAVPTTVVLTRENEDALWVDRRNQFFKPARGYGSRAAYRGEKITRRVWGELLDGDYIAQAFTPPSSRAVLVDGKPIELKVDVRLYTYSGDVILAAARLYQGQTTNMRTPGGGFAPVLELASSRTAV